MSQVQNNIPEFLKVRLLSKMVLCKLWDEFVFNLNASILFIQYSNVLNTKMYFLNLTKTFFFLSYTY